MREKLEQFPLVIGADFAGLEPEVEACAALGSEQKIIIVPHGTDVRMHVANPAK